MFETIVAQVIILSIVLNIIKGFFFKPSNVLNCGLFGFCGNPKAIVDENVIRTILAKIKILGLYNIDRGKHSCGILIDNILSKGVDKEKLFSDFIANNEFPRFSNKNFVVIGHTRQATHGTHTAENAHPFMIDEDFVMAHNGVIRNIWPLCNKYKIDHSKIHVDSLGLAHIINKEGFSVLSEYEGFAALLMTKISEPNSIYVYRGESRRTSVGEMEEERPMFYMQTPEGIYFSSMEISLLAISDSSEDVIKKLEANIVHKFTNGKMTKSKFPVDRSSIVSYASTAQTGYSYNRNGYGGSTPALPPAQGVGTGTAAISTNTAGQTTNSKVVTQYPSNSQVTDLVMIPSIWHETLPERALKYVSGIGIIYHMGRHWVVEKDEIRLTNGTYYINKKGRISSYKARGTVKFFFYEGVMMRNEKCFFAALKDDDLKDPLLNFASNVSKYASFPVCNMRSDVLQRCKNVADYYKFRWYHNGNILQNDGFTPKFSDRNYSIRGGLLHGITANNQLDNGPFFHKEEMEKERKGEKTEAKIIVQTKLPFENPKETKVEDWNVEHFYRIYTNVEHARSTFTELEINALRYYMTDIIRADMGVEVDSIFEEPIDTQLNMFLAACIEKGESVYEGWDSTFPDIIDYLVIAEANPDGSVYPLENVEESSEYFAISEKADCEVCEYVPKPVQTTIDNKLIENEEKSFMIDEAVEKDKVTPKVPESEDEEEDEEDLDTYVDEETKKFAVQDLIDYACELRECADELQAIVTDDFAQDVAKEVYITIDPLLHKIRSLTESYCEEDLDHYINKNIKERLGL